jgi:hypothetical protein
MGIRSRCRSEWDFTIKVVLGVTISNYFDTAYIHRVCALNMQFSLSRICERKSDASLSSVNLLVIVMYVRCVFCKVGTTIRRIRKIAKSHY